MDMNSRAQAIWAKLDEMSAKDPEEYKKFIQEQMAGAQEFFSKNKDNSDRLGSVGGKGGLYSSQTSASFLQEFHKGNKKVKDVSATSGSTLVDQLGEMSIQSKDEPKLSDTDKKDIDRENKLTDEVFTLKSSIVSKITKDKDFEEDEDSPSIVDLRLPSVLNQKDPEKNEENGNPGKSRPLIEEL